MKSFIILLIMVVVVVWLFMSKDQTPEPQINALQLRAKRFLDRPVPKGMNYVPNSYAEQFIRQYAETGTLTLDKEMEEIFQITVQESQNVQKRGSLAERNYLKESADILVAIQAELEAAK